MLNSDDVVVMDGDDIRLASAASQAMHEARGMADPGARPVDEKSATERRETSVTAVRLGVSASHRHHPGRLARDRTRLPHAAHPFGEGRPDRSPAEPRVVATLPEGAPPHLRQLDPDAVDAAALAHDLGHPPFGHLAEEVLDERAARIGGFEGNAQSFRIITRLAQRSRHDHGLNLTRQVLNGDILKQLTWYYVINRPSLASVRAGQRRMIRSLVDAFAGAAKEDDPETYRDRLRVVVDFIAGLTEDKAHGLNERLLGIPAGQLFEAQSF